MAVVQNRALVGKRAAPEMLFQLVPLSVLDIASKMYESARNGSNHLFYERGQTAVPHKPFLVESHRGSSARVRILLADDFASWCSEVRSFVRCQTDWDIVFEAGDGLGAVQKIAELQPDVVVMDLNMPGLNGIEATKRIRQLSPDCIIIILTQYADEDLMAAALSAGAVAYVPKSEMTTELIPAVRSALRKRG